MKLLYLKNMLFDPRCRSQHSDVDPDEDAEKEIGSCANPVMTFESKHALRTYLELCKIKLSVFSAFSAGTGFMITRSALTQELIATVTGVFLMVCGARALNQYQERVIDGLMDRTKKRPIPSGRIKPIHALYFSIIILVTGLSVTALTRNLIVFMLSISAVFLYNGIYTYLKKRTAFASVPCAVIGSIPPAMGWFAGGGGFEDPKILALCSLFYIWQLTHFWLLFLSFGSEYKKAGLPSLTDIFLPEQLLRIIIIWILATAVTCLLIPVYGLIISFNINVLLFFVTIWIIWIGIKLYMLRDNIFFYRFAFNKMNLYILLIMILMNIDRVIS